MIQHVVYFANDSVLQPSLINTKLFIHRFYIMDKGGKKLIYMEQEMYFLSSTYKCINTCVCIHDMFTEHSVTHPRTSFS